VNERDAAVEGFDSIDVPGGRLYVASDRSGAVAELGLGAPKAWESRLANADPSSGRGATARCSAPSGGSLILKRMKRGGLAGPLWRDRFAGTERLLDNLRIPMEALRRGVPTARPVALLLVEGPPGLFRSWQALEEIAGSRDLAQRIRAGEEIDRAVWREAMGVVRTMHDQGVEHRDLNLGNLLIREATPGNCEAFVIDLDAARIHDGPLDFALRQRGLRRLERSWVKLGGESGAPDWFALYAGDDAEMLARLYRGRARGRLLLALRRFGRSRPGL